MISIKRQRVQVPIWVLAGFESQPVGSSPSLYSGWVPVLARGFWVGWFQSLPFQAWISRKKHWLWILSLPGMPTASCLFHFASRELDLATGRLRGPQIWPDRNAGCTLWPGSTECCQLSGELSFSFLCLSLRYGSDSWEGNTLCILFGDSSCVHRVVQYCQEYVLFVLAETWQDIQKDFFKWPYVRKLVKLEVDIQNLTGTFFQAFFPKLKWNYVSTGKEKHSEATVEDFTKTFQRHPALNLEHRNLLISILVEDLLADIKKQIEHNVVGWLGQLLDIIQVTTQFFEKLTTNSFSCICLTNLVITRTEMWLQKKFKAHLPFLPTPKPPPFI